MSPFTQFGSLPGVGGYGGIDRDFSPILNYIDEFDRHFSRRHRFLNCFIPRFDLEEDAHNYYLYGDIPGATIEDITIEAHNNHTLNIYGKTTRLISQAQLPDQSSPSTTNGNDFVKVNVEDPSHPSQNTNPAPSSQQNYPPPPGPPPTQPQNQQTFPPPPQQQQQQLTHPHHERHHTFSSSPQNQNQNQNQSYNPQAQNFNPNQRHILLSERLTGDFHRTFAFPSPVVEEGVKAELENGVLTLVVPKRDAGNEERRGRRVPVLQGGRGAQGKVGSSVMG